MYQSCIRLELQRDLSKWFAYVQCNAGAKTKAMTHCLVASSPSELDGHKAPANSVEQMRILTMNWATATVNSTKLTFESKV